MIPPPPTSMAVIALAMALLAGLPVGAGADGSPVQYRLRQLPDYEPLPFPLPDSMDPSAPAEPSLGDPRGTPPPPAEPPPAGPVAAGMRIPVGAGWVDQLPTPLQEALQGIPAGAMESLGAAAGPEEITPPQPEAKPEAKPEEVPKPRPDPAKKKPEASPAEEEPQPAPEPPPERLWYEVDRYWSPVAGYFNDFEPDGKWSGNVEFGLNGSRGNTETFNYQFGAKARYRAPVVVHDYSFRHVNRSNRGRQVAHNVLVDGRLQLPFPETPWSCFLRGSNEYDDFRAFDFRVSADSGLGYEFLNGKDRTLIGRLGGSFSREVGGANDRYVPELTSQWEFRRKFGERHRVEAQVEYFPDVTDFGEFRLNGKASWEIVIDPDWNLNLKLSLRDRYDSTPNRRESNDLDYAALLLWRF